MKKTVLIIIVVLLIIFFISKSETQKPITDETIRIGGIETLSGNAAYYGNQTKQGIDIALDVIKDKYPEFNVEVYHQDSFFTPKGGVEAYNSLRQAHNIDAVITQASPIAMAVQPLALEDGILQMSALAAVSDYSTPNDLSFRVSSPATYEVLPLIDYINTNEYKKLAILYSQNEIGVSMADAVEEGISSSSESTEVVLKEGFLPDASDFRTLVAKIKSLNADAVFISGVGANIANIVNQSTEIDIAPQFFGFRAAEDPTLLENAPINSNSFIYTYNYNQDDQNEEVRKFVDRYKEKYNEDPDGFAAESYVAALLTMEAFVECGKDYECIQNHLDTLEDHDSLFGKISFDENGDIFMNFFLKEVRDGEFTVL